MINLYDFDNGVCSRTCVYGMSEAIAASKYSFSTDPQACTDEITPTVIRLAQSPKGEGHDNWLCGIVVGFDLTLSVKAWTEAQRYHYLQIVSSMSTMHRAAKMAVEDQCINYVTDASMALAQRYVDEYNELCTPDTKLTMLYNLPVGYRLTARMITNYRQLKTIYSQRKNHELPEWWAFCDWIRELPNAGLFITGDVSGVAK